MVATASRSAIAQTGGSRNAEFAVASRNGDNPAFHACSRASPTKPSRPPLHPEGIRMTVAIIGAGPAGLMAAEVLSTAGETVHVCDGMPSAGRKFLLAGRGGLNLTHSEGFDAFVSRYGACSRGR